MKSTVILGVVAAVLLAFILIFERGTVSTGEVARRGGAVLSRFVRARVAKLEIQRSGETTILERTRDDENDFDLGIWKLASPIQAEADDEAVDVLLGALEWMGNRRRLDDVSSSDRARFGLDTPRYRVWYTVGSERMLMRVGGQTPNGDGVYVEGDQAGSVFVVGKDLPEALDHAPGHYHTKVLHDGVMLQSTLRMTLRTEAGELQVTQNDGRFRLAAPVEGLVSRGALTASLDALDQLKATRFIAAKIDDPARYGFDAPLFEAIVGKRTLVGEPKGKDSKFEERPRRFRLGASCGEHVGESYFVVGDEGPVMCVMEAELGAVRIGLDAMRERRLLNLDDDQVAGVTVTAGTWKLSLTQDLDAKSWRYSVAEPGAKLSEGKAEQASVTDWLGQLRAQTAEEFEQGAADGPVAEAQVRVHFDRIGDNPDYDIALVAGGEPGALVRRADEPTLVRFGPGTKALLRPPAARFFARRLVSRPAGALTSLEVERGGVSERVTRADNDEFTVERPVSIAADRVTLQEVGRLIGALEAVRFVADAAAPEHGLDSPAVIARARFGNGKGKDGESVVLRLGNEIEGGRFAALGEGGAVFVAPAALVRLLSRPLASRTAIATPLEALQSVRVRIEGGAACAIERTGETFTSSTPDTLDDAGAQALARTLSVLRAADASGYGPATEEQGLVAPRTTLVVTTRGGEPHELHLGAVVEDGERPRVHIRRTDIDAGFMLGRDIADALAPCR